MFVIPGFVMMLTGVDGDVILLKWLIPGGIGIVVVTTVTYSHVVWRADPLRSQHRGIAALSATDVVVPATWASEIAASDRAGKPLRGRRASPGAELRPNLDSSLSVA